MSTLILYGFLIAVFSVSYRLILAYEPILNWWFKFGMRYEKKWFYKPVWACEFCFAGQVALWTFLLNWFAINFDASAPFWRYLFKVIPKYQQTDFNALNGLIFIFGTILLTRVLAFAVQKVKNNS